MTREKLKELLPIMQAFADGKKVEYSLNGKNWYEAKDPSWGTNFVYRIASEPKYRPFKTKEECWNEMLKHQPFGWITLQGGQHPGSKAFIIKLTENCFYYVGDGNCATYNLYDYEFNKHFWLFADGTPFGIKED